MESDMKHLKLILLFFCMIMCSQIYTQNIDGIVGSISDGLFQRSPLKFSGNISANITHIHSQPADSRPPLTYQLNGTLNSTIYETFSLPISLNLNNYGGNVQYPQLPNRLALHPKYKWVQTHIGDVSMTFGPYTLNGHQFTGVGVELTPNRLHIAAMGGRLLRRVDFDTASTAPQPNYERWGYGIKTHYEADRFGLGATFFAAHDRANPIMFEFDALNIFPQSNIATSIDSKVKITSDLELSAEYSLSILQRDVRAAFRNYYHALVGSVSYTFWGNTIGAKYERISPEYRTLGAYYFNNDYENITLNYSRKFFANTLSVALSGGIQRDDLANVRAEKTIRFVGSANIEWTPNDRLSASLDASSFNSHRNLKSNFDYINEQMPYENLDTLEFTQISYSYNLGINYKLFKSEKQTHTLSFTASLNEAADRHDTYIIPGNLTRFVNSSTSYNMQLSSTSIVFGVNTSNHYAQRKNSFTWGPSLNVSQHCFKNTLNIGLLVSYNQTYIEKLITANIYNTRLNVGYRFFKKHNLTANLNYQYRQLREGDTPKYHAIISQLSYSYSFGD